MEVIHTSLDFILKSINVMLLHLRSKESCFQRYNLMYIQLYHRRIVYVNHFDLNPKSLP